MMGRVPTYLTVKEVAAIFRMIDRTIIVWLKEDRFPDAIMLPGGTYLIPQADVDAFIKQSHMAARERRDVAELLTIDKQREDGTPPWHSCNEDRFIDVSINEGQPYLVYVLFDGPEIVYIGATRNCQQRLMQHRESEKQFDRVHTYYIGCRSCTYSKELELIRQYQPRYNIHGVVRSFEETLHR